MDWNAQPLVAIMFVIGGIGVIAGLIGASAAQESHRTRPYVKWWVAAAAASLLVVVAAAVMQGFIS